jgi:CHRD domain
VTTRRARLLALAILASTAVAVTATARGAIAGDTAGDDSRGNHNILRVQLTSYQEDPLALSTNGSGQFRAQINERAQEISYQLSYSGLAGAVTQAHIHLGGRAQSGGIIVFLCSNLGNGPAGTQTCPAAPAAISGTIRPADIIGPADQGLMAGQFAALVAAIRAKTAYANVHSTTFPGGEIRGQLVNR